MKILVLGKCGQLGSEFQKISLNYNFNWFFSDFDEVNFYDLTLTKRHLDKIRPNFLINCCAFTNVDQAEEKETNANKLNNDLVKLLAKWTKKNDSKLIHISTDYIFGDNYIKPIKENSKANPLNVYGKTKLLGEISCKLHNSQSIILRTSWLFSSYGNNFLKKIIEYSNQNKPIKVVNDQFGTPTYALDLAEAIMIIICNNEWKPGIYNFTNGKCISWFEFAVNIVEAIGAKNDVLPISSDQISYKAKRPKYSALDINKIKKTYKMKIPLYLESLTKCIKLLKYVK